MIRSVHAGRFPRVFRGDSRRLALILAGIVSAYYAILGLAVLRPEAVYSGDIGVKYVQAQALVANRFRSLNIPYPAEFFDPERTYFPLRPPFVMYVGATTQAIFPPTSTVLQALGVAVAGFRGMMLLTIISAALVLYSAARLAAARDAPFVVVALGLASPLWFYAVSGWEHAPAVALGTLAFALAIAAPPSFAFVAGISVGAGATIRDEMILLLPGLLLATWLRTRRGRSVGVAAAGALVPLLLAMVLEVAYFDRPAAAHLRHAVHMLQAALNTTDYANPDVPVLAPMTRRQQYEAVIQYWLLGYGNDRWIAVFAAAGIVALAARWLTGSVLLMLGWLAGIIVLALIDFRELMTAPKWLAGLLRVAPYLVFAIFQGPKRAPPPGPIALIAAASAAIYLALAFFGADTHGGKSLGPRLLLPILPLLTVSAVMRILSYVRHGIPLERVVGACGIILVCLSLGMHVYGTTVAYYQRNRDDAAAMVALAASRARVIVADDMYTAQLLLPLYGRKVILLADHRDTQAALGGLLARQRIPEIILVSRNPELDVALEPLRRERTDVRGRMFLQYYRR